MPHRLAVLLDHVAHGRYPAADGNVEIVTPPPGRAQAVVAFTAHSVVATSLDEATLRPLLPAGDLGAAVHADTLTFIGQQLGAAPGSLDVVLVAMGSDEDVRLQLRPDESLHGHPRVARARRYRSNVSVWSDERQRVAVILGQGLAGRWEISLDIDASYRGQAVASAAVAAARRLLPSDVPMWAQVAAGNAASLRAFLSAGFTPVGAEVLFLPGAGAAP
jgi:hypothetical protein